MDSCGGNAKTVRRVDARGAARERESAVDQNHQQGLHAPSGGVGGYASPHEYGLGGARRDGRDDVAIGRGWEERIWVPAACERMVGMVTESTGETERESMKEPSAGEEEIARERYRAPGSAMQGWWREANES